MDLLDELVAERDIRKLLALYAQYADDHRNEDWANLFSENGVLQTNNTRMVGREEVKEWLIKVQAGPKMRHLLMNVAINIESPKLASGSLDMHILRAEGSGWVTISAPRYSDRYEKTSEGWKFAERVLDSRRQ